MRKPTPITILLLSYILLLLILNFTGFFNANNRSKLINYTHQYVLIRAEVISTPQTKQKTQNVILKTISINDTQVKEKVLARFPKSYDISYGDIIEIEGYLARPPAKSFTDGFNYANYLSRNNIYTIINVKSYEYISSKINPITKIAIAFRNDLIYKINKYIPKPYSSVLTPMLIGDKSELGNDIKNNFINSGVMHTLVVSGLHIGYIGVLIFFLLKLFGLNFKYASLLSIPILCIYVFATGSNPPATRATIMFSSIFLSLFLNREPLIYNGLALSALIILLFQPQQLFSASFQMSFVATISIIFFFSKISKAYNFKNKILNFFYQLCLVSLCAQILLLPLCIYYFGKVSIVSLFTNIIVLPFIGIVLMLGIIFYFFTFISTFIAKILAFGLTVLLKFIVLSVNFFGSLKYASMEILKPSILQIILFYVLIFVLFFIFKILKRKRADRISIGS